jgi:hypothetical protein
MTANSLNSIRKNFALISLLNEKPLIIKDSSFCEEDYMMELPILDDTESLVWKDKLEIKEIQLDKNI